MLTQSSSLNSLSNTSTLKLHHILQDYKHTEQHKLMLQNKINIMNHHYQSNKKKVKNIQSNIMKINQVKEQFRRQKQEINHMISMEKEKYQKKIAREKEKRQNSKENIQIIRNMIVQEKQKEYYSIKENQRINQLRITRNLKKSLHEKRQRSLQIKLKQEQSRLTKTIFLQKKRLKAQKSSQKDLIPLEHGLSMNGKYLTQMKRLEKQMTKKLCQSRQNLSKSKMSLRKALH